ncbi:hypothetical protein GCM10018781_72890 [Kitasatospora indigofera]|uniref:DUF4259 domain-containing protein n=1 Tax=Kitasatospora indigofera TaxID=67307 RepID=A0A919L5G2_9ACTN|nr:DUF4259 domain-containing protein [Kitasatospora indigofera]GHH84159.1 hypothetical protein GCM10018781_72890 [Kitasatospora indigofera]
MGTWDIGPFGNDTAADFSYTLDETPPGERENLIRTTPARTVQTRDYLDSPEAVETVAAAALVAAQCPAGEPITTSYGPDNALPRFATDLRTLAAEALGRVLADESELAELWDDSGQRPQWRQSIARLRAVLDPRPGSQEEPAAPGLTC